MKSIIDNSALVHQINNELMAVGYIMNKELFDVLSFKDENALNDIYNDLMKGIKKVVGSSGYEPIYKNFPQSVMNLTYKEFAINAILHYWSFGTWRPEDAEAINREYKIEPVKYKEVRLLNKSEYDNIFTDILYSGTSISKFDKECIEFHISNGGNVDLKKIKFKETLAFVGKTLLEASVDKLPTKNATDVLRIWSVYSGGDEGLKENTKFKKPSNSQARTLRNTLNACNNLEDSFKTYREKWLRMLFYLNPLTKENRKSFSQLYKYSDLLRNSPKDLETFNAKVERMIKEEDTLIFNLLANRPGVFTRRLDHLVRVFGKTAIEKYVDLNNINFLNLVAAYNHFTDRDKQKEGRGAILASQSQSNVVTYEALAPLDNGLVKYIKDKLTDRISDKFKLSELKDKLVFIDRSLYYTPLQMNNRASSLALDSKCIGEAAKYNGNKTLRMYVHWEGRTDIDLSGFVITKDNSVQKIGWNARHSGGNFIVYSGDNTGYADKNAEYLDINTNKMASNVEWIIAEARIYSGPRNFAGYKGKCHIGWMEVKHPEANQHWQPKTLQNARVLTNEAKTAYLMAYHAPTQNVVYLDMAMGSNAVSSNEDALKMRMFLDQFIMLDDGEQISWDKLNQGHLLQLRSSNLVEDSKEADLVFDEHTSVDEINRYINA